jgi:tripartite-type tricarboxylate transporter receptor subunit TctC
MRHRRWRPSILIFLGMVAVTPAAAQDYPSRPIHVIVPFGPGTGTDVVARSVGNEISNRTGQPVIIDNRPGAEGQIGAQVAAAAPPDGYTLFITTQTTQAMNVHLYKSLAYDPVKDFAPVTALTRGAQIVMVRKTLPIQSVAELIALAKAKPGTLTFGSGNGSSRGGAELFKMMANVDLLSVPYKTQPQAIADLVGDLIDVTFSDFTTGLPAARDGRARGLAVTSGERIAGLENYPTVQETVPGYEMSAWTACYVPAGTPQSIVFKLNALIREAMNSDTVKRTFANTFGTAFPGTPEALAAFQANETTRWGRIIGFAGMKEP